MIFDNERAEELLEEYRRYGRERTLHDLHDEAAPLLGVIANSISRNKYDDLLQEGHLKFHQLVVEDCIDLERGTMYSFLSRAIRNHMYDVLRRESKHIDCDGSEVVDDSDYVPLLLDVDQAALLGYETARFGLLHDSIVNDAVCYVINSAKECVVDGYRGAIRTICTLYKLERRLASAVYYSTMAVLRMEVSGVSWQCNVADALELAMRENCHATSLMPEVVLLLGKETAFEAAKVFGGTYIKF